MVAAPAAAVDAVAASQMLLLLRLRLQLLRLLQSPLGVPFSPVCADVVLPRGNAAGSICKYRGAERQRRRLYCIGSTMANELGATQ